MDGMIGLEPLVCPNCKASLPSYPDEVAWRCEGCGQAWYLEDRHDRLESAALYFSDRLDPRVHGRPFWVATGQVTFQRETFSGDQSRQAQEFWGQPRRFFLPAFTCSLDTMLTLGRDLLTRPPELRPGPPAPFTTVTIMPRDLRALAEFIVVSFEAERKDQLSRLEVSVQLQLPELWVLPN